MLKNRTKIVKAERKAKLVWACPRHILSKTMSKIVILETSCFIQALYVLSFVRPDFAKPRLIHPIEAAMFSGVSIVIRF